jgi:large subunit ribosomal protein L14
MIQRGSNLTVADNSGARVAKVIGIPKYSYRRYVGNGEIVTLAIQETIPNSNIKRHEVIRGVVARTKQKQKRKDGSYIRFDDNAVVLLDGQKLTPKGTRVFGPVARELKEKGFDKIVSLAPEVL